MSAVIEAGESDFDSALADPGPFLVDFSASWCGPCKAMAPALEAFAQGRGKELPVLKVDIDAARDLANRYGIRSVPTLMLFQDGKPLATRAGMMSESQLASFVEQHLPPRERTPVEQDPRRAQIKLDW